MPIADFENCAKIYKESWSDQIVTEENFCAGIGGRDAAANLVRGVQIQRGQGPKKFHRQIGP